MIRHTVHLKFQTSASDEQKRDIFQKLSDLQGLIPGIEGFRQTSNVSVEAPLVRGFLDVFWFDFVDAPARDTYLDHPEHLKVAEAIIPLLEGGIEGAFVCDVEL